MLDRIAEVVTEEEFENILLADRAQAGEAVAIIEWLWRRGRKYRVRSRE
jgi:hypothetical protein